MRRLAERKGRGVPGVRVRRSEHGAIGVIVGTGMAAVFVVVGFVMLLVLVLMGAADNAAQASQCRPAPVGGGAPAGPAVVPAGASDGSFTELEWLRDFLSRLGAPDTAENRRATLAWMRAEGGHFVGAPFNPLNTSMPAAGATDWNSVGVKSYADYETGMTATLETIRLDSYGYPAIMAALADGSNGRVTVDAVDASSWGTHHPRLGQLYDQLAPQDYADGAGPGSAPAGGGAGRQCQAGAGPVTGGARDLLANPNVVLGPNERADLEAGLVDARIVGVLAWIARDHVIDVGPFKTGHSPCAGGSGYETGDGGCAKGLSNHWYGRAVDIGAVDGAPVSASNAAARAIVEAIVARSGHFELTELGQPWLDGTEGALYMFTEAHGDHLHLGIDS